MADATAQEQLILELINRDRMDPAAAALRYGIDLNAGLTPGTITTDPKQVLAFNPLINTAADTHNQWMINTDTFSHTGAGGTTPKQRMEAAGYAFTGSWAYAENIAFIGEPGAYSNLTTGAERLHQEWFLSSGHRKNFLNNTYKEVGISAINGNYGGTNGVMGTEDFAKSGTASFLTGVTYNDTDNNDFYSIGEGMGGRSVSLWQSGTQVGTTTSGAAGGYALGTTITGTLELRFSGSGLTSTMGVAVTMAT
ncbi:MAG TPA: CAP domain-containing protein, partial [Aestuariivirga sp.]|nr:CAP domain-containing protein [Aestuariivirga sp.]